MKKKTRLKIVSTFLALSLSLSVFSSLSVAADEPNLEQELLTDSTELWQPQEEVALPTYEGDLSLEELETAELAPEDTPEIVSQEVITEKEHVNRLWEQEDDLNTIIFQNKDGEKTMYYYAEPVKYKDGTGAIKDKKNKLTEKTDTYTNEENDINAYFPKKLHKNKGVVLKHQDINLEIAPLINGSSGASRQTGQNKDNLPAEYVEYPAVFDDSISVRYTPTFKGFKEDIILYENVGINTFCFKLKTNGLQLTQEDGFVFLLDPLDGQAKAYFSPIYVYDSFAGDKTEENSHDSYNNQVIVETLEADQEYLLTVVVDEEFLNAPDTVYPVYVDPSAVVMGGGDIEDAAIYSNINYNLSASEQQQIKIGYDSFYGTGRGLYNFPIMEFTSDIFLYGNQITSASLNLYYLSISSNDSYSTLSLYEFGSGWSENTVKWNNTNPNNYGRYISQASIGGSSGYKSFDISYIINQFKTDVDYTTAFKGLLLKADSESGTWKKFASSEGASGRQPYIQITYNDQPTVCSQIQRGAVYYIRNYNSRYLDISNAETSAITYPFHGGTNQQFKIVNVTGAEYEIYPMFDTSKVLSSNGTSVYIDADCNLTNQRWYIYYRNEGCHFVNKAYLTKLLEQSCDAVDNEVTLGREYAHCCWDVIHTDPFHPSNIEYIRIKKYDQSSYGGDSDITTIVTKSYLEDHEYFEAYAPDRAEVSFKINQTLIDELNSLEELAHNGNQILTSPAVLTHMAKLTTDDLVSDGIISNGSAEYYGIWVITANQFIQEKNNIINQIQLAGAVITTAYSIYNIVSAIKTVQMAANTTQTIYSSAYQTAADNADDLLTAPQNKSYFWSGKTDGVGGEARALEIANSRGGYTLEKLIKQNSVPMPEWDANNSTVVTKWQSTSLRYAQNASGKVYAIIGTDVRADSVWLNYELPALKANPNVTQIIKIDPKTLVETIIYTR